MVVTETKRVDNTWILDGQLTDRTTLSEELAQFCAKYFIYQVKMTQDSLNVAKGKTTNLSSHISSRKLRTAWRCHEVTHAHTPEWTNRSLACALFVFLPTLRSLSSTSNQQRSSVNISKYSVLSESQLRCFAIFLILYNQITNSSISR